MERLTPDLVKEILSRLPIRSVLQVKRVCKSWLTITSDPIFSTLHLSRSSSSFPLDAIIYLYHKKYLDRKKQIYFYEQPNLEAPSFSNLFTRKIDLSLVTRVEDNQDIHVVGACNGLLCVAYLTPIYEGNLSKAIYILNPITGEHKQLPDFQMKYGEYDVFELRFGFGFDNLKQVFKVVVFVNYIKGKTIDCTSFESKYGMFVCTFGRGSKSIWRRQMDSIPEVLFESVQMNLNALIDGSLHLIGNYGTFVVAFHLGSEDFEVIQTAELTEHNSMCDWKYYTLGVIEDCLSFVDAAGDNFVQIWLRKKENGIASWVKQFSIDKELLDPRFRDPIELMLIKYNQNGELLLLFHTSLVSYNPKNNTSKFFDVGGDRELETEKIYQVEAFPFVGSLISVEVHA